MLVEISKINWNIEVSLSDSNSDYIFFLHGFTGNSSDWETIISSLKKNFNSAAIDFIGHGKSDSPVEIDFYRTDFIINQLNYVFNHFTNKQIFLIGYSMGGRAALSYAVKYPQKVKGLILESSTAGIKDEKLRGERIAEDESLADYIENHSVSEFVDYWMDLNLFNTQLRFSNEKRNQIRKEKLQNNKTGLVNILRGFGTGIMPPLFNQLKNIKSRILLITGGLDTKFTEINSEIVKVLPSAEHIIIKNTGHNTHLEKPQEFIKQVDNFLKRF